MSCLTELLFEFLLELILEAVWYCYLKAVMLLFPKRTIDERTRSKIKKGVSAVSALLMITAIVGVILLLGDDPALSLAGRLMTFIPIGILSVAVVAGIIARLVRRSDKE